MSLIKYNIVYWAAGVLLIHGNPVSNHMSWECECSGGLITDVGGAITKIPEHS